MRSLCQKTDCPHFVYLGGDVVNADKGQIELGAVCLQPLVQTLVDRSSVGVVPIMKDNEE
jgi:hypothetical protein